MRSLICFLLLVLTGCGEVFVAADETAGFGGQGGEFGRDETGGRDGTTGGRDSTGGRLGATGGDGTIMGGTGGTGGAATGGAATGGASTGGAVGTGGAGCTVEWLPDCRGIVYSSDEELYADPDCKIPGVRTVYDVRYHYEPDPLKVNDAMCKASNDTLENVWVIAARDVAAYRWTWYGSSGTCSFVPSPEPVGGSERVHVRLVPGVLDDYRLEGCL